MDNDSTRRGKPTNHIVFGETTALLAGDALLTEAFSVISKYYADNPSIGLSLIQILARSSGFEGMVGGQALDLSSDLEDLNIESLQWIHQLKTGALIQAVAEGVAIIAELPLVEQQQVKEFGSLLGFAFQLKDDLLDYDPKSKDYKNLVYHLGINETQKMLERVSQSAQEKLYFLTTPSEVLNNLVQYNITRSL
jgi:geranylgeranyl diphosphate synthase type II